MTPPSAWAAALAAAGWTVCVADLSALGFDPCERPEHFADRADPARFDAQGEQRHATETATPPAIVTDELAPMDRADLLVLPQIGTRATIPFNRKDQWGRMAASCPTPRSVRRSFAAGSSLIWSDAEGRWWS